MLFMFIAKNKLLKLSNGLKSAIPSQMAKLTIIITAKLSRSRRVLSIFIMIVIFIVGVLLSILIFHIFTFILRTIEVDLTTRRTFSL